ncbi:MAG TPA: prepilin-type N-terminal cleavage/methylation domain-containing protein [Usitatibacter sp.]|nr:prepilin-type N-terminal cleavage/methylation domain-containing protein [Usitatibacter sp.]
MGIERQRGFTLIEVVTAFVMLTLVLAVSYEVFATGLKRAGDLEDYSQALAIAQSRLAEAGLGEHFEQGQTMGESEDRRYRWTLSISKFDDGRDPAVQQVAAYLPVRMAVRVSWVTGSQLEKHLDLSTLVVGKID